MDLSEDAPRGMRPYPTLEPARADLINSRLAEIVSLLHGEGLTAEQTDELAACIALQTRHTETLHRFRLDNHDEPAFTIDTTQWHSDG